MTHILIGRQFCGPPNSGNGGYVCGLLADGLEGPARAILRAPIPLDVQLTLSPDGDGQVLTGPDGDLIGRGDAAVLDLEIPPAPSLEAARAASGRYIGHEQRVHPICFTCGADRADGDGLRVFPGQLAGAPQGHVACLWAPHAAFADARGLVPAEMVWAALDCPGYFAWVESVGRHGALLGTMTGEVIRRPRAGETCIVLAWPLVREGRKETAGVALFSGDGELMARGHQVWIMMGPRPDPSAAAAQAADA
ncbi:MAG: hypothetical protein ABI655_02090 [Phenylobacterium sp.]